MATDRIQRNRRLGDSLSRATAFVIFLIIVVCVHAMAAPREVRVGAYANPPKIDRLDDGTVTGFWADLVREIAAQEEWEITWVWGSWQEGLDRLRRGEIDMMTDVAYSPQRAKIYKFSEESVFLSWTRLYVREDNETIREIPDLAGLTVAALAGSVNLDGPGGLRELDSSFELGCTFLELDTYAAVFSAVQDGRADGGITNRNFGTLRAMDFRIRRTPITFQLASLRFAFSAASPTTSELVAATDQWLAEAKLDGASVYYTLLNDHFEAGVTEREVEVLPDWLGKVLRVLALVMIVGLVVLILSRWQVRRRTADLEDAHQALMVSERRYGEIFDSTSDAIFIHDAATGRLLEVNRSMLEMYGCTRAEALSHPVEAFCADVPPYTAREAAAYVVAAVAGKPQVFEWQARRLGGDTFWVEVSLKAAEFGGERFVIAVARDISDRRRMEGEMLKNAKLQSLGVLAGGIAHDFNNLLTAVLGNISLAATHTSAGGPVALLLRETEAAAVRATGLAQQLLTFARGGDPVRSTTDIDRVVRDAAEFVLRGSGTSCSFRISADLRPADVDAGQIGQVVQNLVINARQATADGGHIIVTCANVETTDAAARAMVQIVIKDDGPGIAPGDLGKVFDPYFSTKPEGGGLGLSICHSIVARHGGEIRIDSRPDEGTSVIVDLPAAERQAVTPAPVPEQPRSFDQRVLIMDDDDGVRRLLTRMLDQFGCRVEESREGAEAITIMERLAGDDDPIVLVILDLTIPGGMGGLEALKWIRAIDPNVRAIVSSGYSNDPVIANFRDHGFQGVIVKPYRLAELNEVVASVLGDGSTSPG